MYHCQKDPRSIIEFLHAQASNAIAFSSKVYEGFEAHIHCCHLALPRFQKALNFFVSSVRSSSVYPGLHFSAFLYILLHFSASPNFFAFLYISLHSYKFLCISLHFTFYILGQIDGAYRHPMDAIFCAGFRWILRWVVELDNVTSLLYLI